MFLLRGGGGVQALRRIRASPTLLTRCPALRGDVHWVVTEFGAAQLWGKTVRQRAAALIEIAHPRFRDELRAYARQQRWL